MRQVLILLIVITASASLISCGSSKEKTALDSNPTENKRESSITFSEEELKIKAPNSLFKSIYDYDFSTFITEVTQPNFDFREKNSEGDTALAVSIKLNRPEITSVLISIADSEDLRVPNKNGRSFVSLLSERNQIKEFDELDRNHSSFKSWTGKAVIYQFNRLDFKDDFGKNAAHYAKSKAMIDRLYHKSFEGAKHIDHAFNDQFFYAFDEEGNGFIHNAALDQRTAVIRWYVENFCGLKQEGAEGFFSSLESAGKNIYNSYIKVADYVADTGLIKLRYINRQNEQGNTALHLAASQGNEESLRELLKCDNIDPTLNNLQERLPISELLVNIDPYLKDVPENYKKSFDLLYEKKDPVVWGLGLDTRYLEFKDILVDKDLDGMTALHYAAQIEDPYFFEKLEDYMMTPVKNRNNQTPLDLRR